MVRLDIPDAIPSLNKLLRMHWSQRKKLAGQWAWLVKSAVLERRVCVRCLPKARITIERYGPRKLDTDNLVGGSKPIIDQLVREGFIVDDSPDHVMIEYRQTIGRPHTTICVEAA